MQQIVKFPLTQAEEQSFAVAPGIVLGLVIEHQHPWLHMLVRPDSLERRQVGLMVLPTGRRFEPDVGAYIGSFEGDDMLFYHVFQAPDATATKAA
jgi:hypothetical protein